MCVRDPYQSRPAAPDLPRPPMCAEAIASALEQGSGMIALIETAVVSLCCACYFSQTSCRSSRSVPASPAQERSWYACESLCLCLSHSVSLSLWSLSLCLSFCHSLSFFLCVCLSLSLPLSLSLSLFLSVSLSRVEASLCFGDLNLCSANALSRAGAPMLGLRFS